uniref:BTB domain-containing protein n=1 Tax=Setaria digitata TaxID=48799 RepID=A0A915PXM8_9BILA
MEQNQPKVQQQLALDVVWVVPGEIRKHFLQEELHYDRLEAGIYLNWSASTGLKNYAKVVLGNGYACSAPACLLAAFSEIFRKLILAQTTQQQLSSGREIIIRLSDMPSLTNAGLYNVIAFIQNGQIKFLETELENILTAANDLRVISLVSLICEEMTARILENTSSAIPLLYTAVACLPSCSQYRSMVVDGAAKKFRDIVGSADFIKLSFEMLFALISSPVLQTPEWIMEIYKAIIIWLRSNNDQIHVAPALLDNVNFKVVINTIDNRRDILNKSLEVPELGPIIHIFLMDAIYARFSDDLVSMPIREQSLSSSIYTVSGAETVNLPTTTVHSMGFAASPLGSYVIPPFDSTSSATTRSVSNEAQASMDKNWYQNQQLPTGTGTGCCSTGYQTTPTATAQGNTGSFGSNTGRKLWSEILSDRHMNTAKSTSENTAEMASFHSGISTPSKVVQQQSKSFHDLIKTPNTARSGSGFTYLTASGSQQDTEAGTASSLMAESVGIRTSSSQESASSSKRRLKFEQIPLRTEPPKSRKELRKERQARERAEKK